MSEIGERCVDHLPITHARNFRFGSQSICPLPRRPERSAATNVHLTFEALLSRAVTREVLGARPRRMSQKALRW
jgi:hypothetical protein